ncbi:MAG: M28 family peptidase [Bacteroidota bacterium]
MITRRFLLLTLFFSLLSYGLLAQVQVRDLPTELATTIRTDDMRKHLTILSADDMEGRETGEPGQKKAAAYLVEQLQEMGFPAIGENGGYYQTILFKRQTWKKIELTANGKTLRHLRDYYSVPADNNSRTATNISELTFLGYGIDDTDYSDYTGAGDLTGSSILIFAGEPRDKNGNFRLTGSNEPSRWSSDVNTKLTIAKEKGIATVFIIDPDFRTNVGQLRRAINSRRLQMAEETEAERSTANSVYLNTQLAKDILGKSFKKVIKSRKKLEKKGKLKTVKIPTAIQLTQEKEVSELIGENVLGYMEGSDPALKDEIVVFSAHYDHIGKRGKEVFNGADDNGSGTTAILEVAQAFVTAKAMGKGPRRSVLFVWVSGEEKGLLGSQYYVNHPVFPLENTVVDINVDMVGRVDKEHADNPEYIYVIGSDRLSTDLHRINEEMNTNYTKIELDYTYNAEDDPNRYYYRSDHYNFAKQGIPSIFYFNGTHEDYHGAGDTVDKINFDKMAKIGQLIFHTGWNIANRDERIKVDVGQ